MSDFKARIVAELDTSKIPSSISKIEKQNIKLSNITLDTKGLSEKIQQALNGHQFTLNLTNVRVDNLSNTITGQMRNAGTQAGQGFSQSLLNKINNTISNGGIDASVANVTQKFEQLNTVVNNMGSGNKVTELQAKLHGLESEFTTLKSLQDEFNKGGISDGELVSKYEQFNNILFKIKNRLSEVSSESKNFASSLQVSTLDNKMSIWLERNTKAAKNFGERIQELRNNLAELQSSGGVTSSQFSSIENEFNEVKQAAIAAGQTGKSFKDTFAQGFKSISNYVSISSIIYQSINALKQMYQNVYNIDKEMTELKKVTNETDASYSNFLKSAATSSKQIGITISDLVSSTADFARLGYTFADAQELAKVANIYSVVGDDIDGIDTATKSLISTMTAFKGEMSESVSESEFALSIIDKFNEVGNNFAISSGGIGDALERSASSLSAANNSLDQSIALITAANTVVQDPESVGTAFKTITMRIRGAKSELESAGLETDSMAESTSKLREEIKALSGVDIMLDEDTFKSTYDILDELSSKWQDLSDISQASIIELIAGKRQGNVISSLMENFDIAREAMQTAADSEGSAMAEHEKWLDSLEAKTLQFKAAWEGLSQSFMDDSFLKGMVDTGTELLSVITNIIDKFGTLPTLATLLTGAFSLKNVGRNEMFFLNSSIMPTTIIFYLDINSFMVVLNEIH